MSGDITTPVAVFDNARKRLSTLSPVTMSAVVFACVFCGALLGMFIHSLVPKSFDKARQFYELLQIALRRRIIAISSIPQTVTGKRHPTA